MTEVAVRVDEYVLTHKGGFRECSSVREECCWKSDTGINSEYTKRDGWNTKAGGKSRVNFDSSKTCKYCR